MSRVKAKQWERLGYLNCRLIWKCEACGVMIGTSGEEGPDDCFVCALIESLRKGQISETPTDDSE